MSQRVKIEDRPLVGPPAGDDSGPSARGDRADSNRLDTTVARRYHLTRLVIDALMFLVSMVLVLGWGWLVGLIVAAIAVGAGTDAWMRYRGHWSQSALLPLFIDSTAFGTAIVFGQLPLETVIPPFAYIAVSVFSLVKVRTALRFLPYPAAWVVVHLFVVDTGGWSGSELWIVRSVSLLTFLAGMVAILIAASGALQFAEWLDQQLRARERQLELTVTGAPVILFAYDAQGVFTLSEGAALEKLGLVPGEVVGLSAIEVYAQAPEVLSGVKRSLLGESFADIAQVGDLFFQVQYQAQFDDAGNLERVIGVATDISDRVAAEAALEALVRTKDQFVATIAHELRTPLTAVVGLSEELRSGYQAFEPDEIAEFVNMIADQGHEVAAIVEDLLVAARANMGRVSVASQNVDLERAVEAVLAETNHLRTSSTCSISLVGSAGSAVADPQRVRQILRNLVINAFRYGGEDVWIELEANSKWSRVVVADSGSGIPESEQDSIFEAFRRAHNTPGQPGSMGLGLFVARQLAEMMNGTLTYRRVGSRTQFELALPAGPRDQGV